MFKFYMKYGKILPGSSVYQVIFKSHKGSLQKGLSCDMLNTTTQTDETFDNYPLNIHYYQISTKQAEKDKKYGQHLFGVVSSHETSRIMHYHIHLVIAKLPVWLLLRCGRSLKITF